MSLLSKIYSVPRIIKLTETVPLAIKVLNLKYACSYSTGNKSELTRSQERADVSTDVRPIGEKIKEGTKTVSYTGVILAGVGFTGVIFYYVFRELFSSNSPNSIYSTALEKCKNDPRIEDALGAPIKGYGEETTRRRRNHVQYSIYEKDGVKHMQMIFYLKGIRNKAVAQLNMKQNEYGNYMCRYLLVQLDDFSGKTFIVEDNRAELDHNISSIGSEIPELNLS